MSAYISSFDAAYDLLKQRGILMSTIPRCVFCGKEMSLIKKDDTKIFRCSVHKSEKMSIRKGSFLSNSKLLVKLETFILIVYTWPRKIPVNVAVDVIGVSEVTIIQWYQYIRDVTSHHLLNNAYQIGGVGHIVEIDETLMSKRKHSVGRLPVQR